MKKIILHLDEAGRGPLAWPVSVWCVMKLARVNTSDFQDSKILTESKRESLYIHAQTLQQSGKVCLGGWFSSAQVIDSYGIIKALHHASIKAIFSTLKNYFQLHRSENLSSSVENQDKTALSLLTKLFHKRPSTKALKQIIYCPNSFVHIQWLLIDGNHTFWLETSLDVQVDTLIKGDSKNSLISMASIIAKVTRDRYMVKQAKKYQAYGFEQHKWYGTQKHREALATHGLSSFHRKSFCGNIIKQ